MCLLCECNSSSYLNSQKYDDLPLWYNYVQYCKNWQLSSNVTTQVYIPAINE